MIDLNFCHKSRFIEAILEYLTHPVLILFCFDEIKLYGKRANIDIFLAFLKVIYKAVQVATDY